MNRLELAGRTHMGRVRDRNEDHWTADEGLGLVAVADGMGGHPAGDVASRLAVETVVQELSGSGGSRSPSSRTSEGEGAGGRMAEAVRSANRRILEDGEENPERMGMGTTLTVLTLDPEEGRYRVAHVGDSRAYLLRDASLEPLTRDQTPLQREVDAGRMTREEARVHPMSNVLAQALGTAPEVDPQVTAGEARAGDLFLVCSDGLTAVLSDARIETLVAEDEDGPLEEIADLLVEATLNGGAPDNVTVALARLKGAR